MNLNQINPKLNEGSIDIDSLLYTLLSSNKTDFQESVLELEQLIESFDFEEYFTFIKASINKESDSDLFIDNINKAYLAYFILNQKLLNIIELYNQLSSYEEAKIKAIQRIESQIINKLSTIDSYRGIYKFFIKESFPFTTSLETKFISLPIDIIKDVAFNKHQITTNSTGTIIGDFSIQSYNEKAILDVEFFFPEDSIINGLLIDFNPNQETPIFIDSIISNNDQLLPIKENIIENELIVFLPSQTNKLIIRFSSQFNNNQLSSILIDNISFKKIKYSKNQELLSEKFTINNSPSSVVSYIDYLGLKDLSNITLKVSLNGSEFINADQNISVSNIKEMVYKLNIERNDSVFSSISSYDNKTEYEYAFQQSSLSKNKFPNNLILTEKILNNNINLYYPKIYRLSYKDNGLLLGRGIGLETRLELPFELTYEELVKASIKIDGAEWSYTDTLSTSGPTDLHWTIDKNSYRYIVFGDNTNGQSPSDQSYIYLSLPLEPISLEKIDEGYVAYLKHTHDPDPANIKLYSVNESVVSSRFILPKSNKVIQLPYKNIVVDSEKITEKYNSGSFVSTYTLRDKKTFVDGSSELINDGDYSIDYTNGRIYSYTLTPLTTYIVINFSYYPIEEYNTIINTLNDNRIFVKDEDLKVKSYTDLVTSSHENSTRLGLDGITESTVQTPTSSSNTFYLSRNSIIKGTVNAYSLFNNADDYLPEEIDYINGVDEFYNLINVKAERLTDISGSGLVTFTLNGGSNYYKPLGITFSDNTIFATEQASSSTVNVAGEWHISDSGVVTVYLASGMSDVTCSYHYKNDLFTPTNKYSIDYKNSILYSLDNFKASGYVTYQCGNYYIGYDIVEKVTNYEIVDNIVVIKEEPKYNNIKISYPTGLKKQSIETLKDYYSPLIKFIEFRFT